MTLKERYMDNDLIRKHFQAQNMSTLLKKLFKVRDKNKNKLTNVIKSRLRDLEQEIKEMSEDEYETEKPNEIVDIAEKITKFNNQNQEGNGLKILTSDQMLSRLPISLAQLKVGNNTEKLKNEIRPLFYSLYCSIKSSKIISNNLINTI